jgi:hypothetical protein
VVRQADTRASEAPDVRDFLDDLGEANYGIGKARSLGSVAVVMVDARDMGVMLQEKYNRSYGSQERIEDLHRKIAKGLTAYVHSAFGRSYANQTEELRLEHIFLDVSLQGFVSGDEPDDDTPDVFSQSPWPAIGGDFSEVDRLCDARRQLIVAPVATPHYADAVVEVGGIELCGKDGYGLDPGLNDQLYAEQRGIKNYLPKDEGLNTSRLNKGWWPHATVFQLEDHIPVAQLIHPLTDVPTSLALRRRAPIVTV